MLKDRPARWEKHALNGDFSLMPKPFTWEQSGRLAHYLNGYEEAGGFMELARLAETLGEVAREKGQWQGAAKDLWSCLFYEHRMARHTGSYPEESAHHDSLCEALRVALQALEPHDARALASRLRV